MIRKKEQGTLDHIHYTTSTGGLISNSTKRNKAIPSDGYRLDGAAYIMYQPYMAGNIFFARYTKPRPLVSFMGIYYCKACYFISIKYD
jgi:hypothetical protein